MSSTVSSLKFKGSSSDTPISSASQHRQKQLYCTERQHEINPIEFICLQQHCTKQRLYCSKCALKHSPTHGQFLVSLSDVFSSKPAHLIDNFPKNLEQQKLSRILQRTSVAKSSAESLIDIITQFFQTWKTDFLHQIAAIQEEILSSLRYDEENLHSTMRDLTSTAQTIFRIDDLRYLFNRDSTDQFLITNNINIWIAESVTKQHHTKTATQNLITPNSEMIPAILQQHQDAIDKQLQRMRDNLVNYVEKGSTLPSHLAWGFENPPTAQKEYTPFTEIQQSVCYSCNGKGNQLAQSNQAFSSGRHEFEIEIERMPSSPQSCHFIMGLVNEDDAPSLLNSTHMYTCVFCEREHNLMRSVNHIQKLSLAESKSYTVRLKIILDFDKDTFYITDEKNTMISSTTSLRNRTWRFIVAAKTEFKFSTTSPQLQLTLIAAAD